MKSDAKNYFDAIGAYSQNPEGLHRTNQEQYACSKPSGRRGPNRILREAQCENRGVTKQTNRKEMQAMDSTGMTSMCCHWWTKHATEM